MFQLHKMVMDLSVSGDKGVPVTFLDICYKTVSGSCSRSGFLDFWNFNFSFFTSSIGGSATDPNAGDEVLFRSQVSQLTYPDGG